MHRMRTTISLIILMAVISTSGCDFTQEANEAAIAAFGSSHTPIGAARLQGDRESVAVDLSDPAAAGGVAVAMSSSERLNVYFEPIEMPVGSHFETAVVGVVDGHETVLGKITHRQTGARTTAIGVDFNELRRYSESERVRVATFVDGIQTYSTTVSMDSTVTVGFVESGESGWATSYHWVYINGAWSLMVDPAPSETFAFAGNADVRHPFNYLVFTLEDVHNVEQPATMEFFGNGLKSFKIVDEDDRRLIY